MSSMQLLVADYGASSASESESDCETHSINAKTEESDADGDPQTVATTSFRGVNLLSAELSSDDEQNQETEGTAAPGTSHNKLPTPLLASAASVLAAGKKISIHNSVFSSPFDETAKHNILEQHVKMSEVEKDLPKKICYNYKRGKCNFGAKCRYRHDQFKQFSDQPPEFDPESSGEGSESKKKRSGVTNALLPPKKARQALAQERAKERPWTILN